MILQAKTAKPSQKSDWKDGFLFLGNAVVLDFLNTRPVKNGEAQQLLLEFAAPLRWFRAAELLTMAQALRLQEKWSGKPVATKTLQEIRELREMLRTDVAAWEKGEPIRRGTVDTLNRLAAEHPMRTRLVLRSNDRAIEPWFEINKPEGLFAPVVQSAAQLFAEADPRKVRKCEQCVLHFLDTSKKGTRRWCSMQLCGNRRKVAAYAARQRGKQQ